MAIPLGMVASQMEWPDVHVSKCAPIDINNMDIIYNNICILFLSKQDKLSLLLTGFQALLG